MKLTKKIAYLMGVVGLTSTAAFADFQEPAYYVGLEGSLVKSYYQKNNAVLENIRSKSVNGEAVLADNPKSVGVFIGSKIHTNIGVEANLASFTSVDTNFKSKEGDTITYNTKVRAMTGHLSAMGYMPVADNLELIATAGVAFVKPKITIKAEKDSAEFADFKKLEKEDKIEMGLRYGIGAQYKVDNITARLMLTQQHNRGLLKKVRGVNLGLAYNF